MTNREVNGIFRDAAYMAGDIVFCYDLKNGKLMQYSDKSELSRYGSWLTDFDEVMLKAHAVHPDDEEKFIDISSRIKNGEKGTIEGTIRFRFSVRGEYRWYNVLARTSFEKGAASLVIGRAVDVNTFVNQTLNKNDNTVHTTEKMPIKDREEFIDYIIRYSKNHKTSAFTTCIIFRIPSYDDVINKMSSTQTKEFFVNFTRKIRRCFPNDAAVSRIGAHRFAIFTGEIATVGDVGTYVSNAIMAIKQMGKAYDVDFKVWTGVSAQYNIANDDMSVFDKAVRALDKAKKCEDEKIIFYSKDHRKSMKLNIAEVVNDSEDDYFTDYAAQILSDSAAYEETSAEKISAESGMVILSSMAKFGKKYGFERLTLNVCRGDHYEQFKHWEDESISSIPDGMLLHTEGNANDIEEKINFWEPYVLNNVESYPDDSRYGRMIRFSAAKSVLQHGFECNDGTRCIASIEFYNMPHRFTEQDLAVLDKIKYVADLCIKYINLEKATI